MSGSEIERLSPAELRELIEQAVARLPGVALAPCLAEVERRATALDEAAGLLKEWRNSQFDKPDSLMPRTSALLKRLGRGGSEQ